MVDIYDQLKRNMSAGDDFVKDESLSSQTPLHYPVRFIAFFLPQFHMIPENDEWWGRGFTEWTNVTKSLPRYKGHLQPRLPGELGFYDLSHVDTLYRQAELARRGGVSGFCIHDYWFAGRKVLETPLKLLLEHKDIDLPFCLNWANENWSRRWDGSEDEMLLRQIYDPNKLTGYAESILPALSDPRYIKVNGRPLLLVYRPELIPDPHRVFDAWRSFLVREGVGNPYLVRVQNFANMDPRDVGMDASVLFPPHTPDLFDTNDREYHPLLDLGFSGLVRDYRELAESVLKLFKTEYVTFPGVVPGWDNEARRPRQSLSFAGASPARYGQWLTRAAEQVVANNAPDERLVFINAWNEWAEGAVIEPDRHFGHAYLAETRAVLDHLADPSLSRTQQVDERYRRNISTRYLNRIRRRLGKYGLAGRR